MTVQSLVCVGMTIMLVACDGPEEAAQGNGGAAPSRSEATGNATIKALPDPCEWLGATEAQDLLGLDEALAQTALGDAQGSGRSCVYTNADQSKWINVSYQGLNPQVFSPKDKSTDELIELASTMYANGLEHLDSSETDGRPTLAFGNAERTTLIVFSGVGKARELPEDMPEGYSISSYINAILTLFDAAKSQEARLAELEGLVDRPMSQLLEAASN